MKDNSRYNVHFVVHAIANASEEGDSAVDCLSRQIESWLEDNELDPAAADVARVWQCWYCQREANK